MAWSSVIGQERVKALLRRSLEQKSVAHAYLFHGREGIGKDALALEFAKILQCERQRAEACDECTNCRKAAALQHPDIRVIVALPPGKGEESGDDPLAKLPDDLIDTLREQLQAKAADPYHEIQVGKAHVIKINSVRDVKREAALSPVEGRYKIFVILNADQMNTESANSLLKTLEEPLPNAVLLLTSAYRDRMPSTIASRCQQVECSPLRTEEIVDALTAREHAVIADAETAALLADGSYRRARAIVGSNLTHERSEVVQFLRVALGAHALQVSAEIERVAEAHDRPSLEDWLVVLQSWLRDAMALQAGQNLGDARRDAAMENFLKKFPAAGLVECITVVDRAIADLRKNVYIPLILTTLAQELRSSVRALPQRP